MVARCVAPAVLRLGLNEKGRDLIVGDIHGCFDLVLRAMEKVRFDAAVDRLFSVGDLIDRGPTSHETARFLAQPFVHACRGNHEDMLMEIYEDGDPGETALRFFARHNGFGWWLDTPDDVRSEILEAARKLPIAIELATARGMVGLVHADVPYWASWQEFIALLESGDTEVMKEAMSCRDRITSANPEGVAGVGRVFVGHTPLTSPLALGNLYAVDTGAVFGVLGKGAGGAITIVDATARTQLFRDAANVGHPVDLVRSILSEEPVDDPFDDLLDYVDVPRG
jgi:serine/threonine protein phosphatase 1